MDAPPTETRDRIRHIAEELYVLRGHDGFSFGDIAAAIGTTRANIHHHFGSKHRLMSELVQSLADNAVHRITIIWQHPAPSFATRLQAQTEDLRRFHARFNPAPGDRNVWSPIARIRLDLPTLGTLGLTALQRVNAAYDQSLQTALAEAIASHELHPQTPIDDLTRLLRTTFLNCGPTTQDGNGFPEVEALLNSLQRTIIAAWGKAPSPSGRGPG